MPRRTTVLTLIGVRPADCAAAIPSSTLDTGKSTPFIVPKTSSSSESSETVIRCSPASASGTASARSADPFVVSVRSTASPEGARSAASSEIRTGRSRRTRGSPPVIRSLPTPSPTKIAREPADLLEREDELLGQEREVAAEDLGRHAVRAAEVAAVGDRDPEIAQGAAEPVGHPRPAVEVRGRTGRPDRRRAGHGAAHTRRPDRGGGRRCGGTGRGTRIHRPIVARAPDAHAHRPHPAVPPEWPTGTSSDSTTAHLAA